MSTCFDTSALVKLLVGEGGLGGASEMLWAGDGAAFASIVGYAELRGSMLRGRLRGGRITRERVSDRPGMELERLWGSPWSRSGSTAELRRARDSSRTGMASRALDAIHLASALSIATPGDRPTS